MTASQLPDSNPVCVHVWLYDPTCSAWVCADCGYRITAYDLMQPVEAQS